MPGKYLRTIARGCDVFACSQNARLDGELYESNQHLLFLLSRSLRLTRRDPQCSLGLG